MTNTGNVTLASVAVSDPTAGDVNCPPPAAPGLAPGASETCTADNSYRVTQADVDNGSVVDTATATGTGTGTGTQGNTSPASAPATATVPTVAAAPSVSLAKIGEASGGDSNPLVVGETIPYDYLVTNTGNVDLASVAVSDPNIGAVTCPPPAAPGLAPGDQETCTSATPHTVTQADVNLGSVSDTATATGKDTKGAVSPVSDPSTFVVSSTPMPKVVIHKTAAVTPAADQEDVQLGDTIAYSYLVTNVGNVTLTSVAVDDPTIGNVTCPTPATPGLDPGAAETCTADSPYVVAQPDMDNGKVVDTATATGTDIVGGTSPPSDPSTVTIETVPPSPLVGIAKTGAVSPSGDQEAAQAGDTIQYSYLVTNTGNVTLTSVAVDDPTVGPTTCPTPTAPGLAPGSAETCTADAVYTVTQADVDRGSVTDTATATGTDARGDAAPPSDPSTATIDTVVPAPAVSVVKSADASGGDDNPLFTGETISYSYLVTNTGNVTLTSVAVDDPTLGPVTCPPPTVRGLVPNASVTCAANSAYIVTPEDVDRGFVTDTATATGADTDGDTSPVSAPSTVVVPTGSVTTPPPATSQLSSGPGPGGTAPGLPAPPPTTTTTTTTGPNHGGKPKTRSQPHPRTTTTTTPGAHTTPTTGSAVPGTPRHVVTPTTTTTTTTAGGPGAQTQTPPTTTPPTTPPTSPTSPTSLPTAHGKTTSTTTTPGANPTRIAPGTKTTPAKPTPRKPHPRKPHPRKPHPRKPHPENHTRENHNHYGPEHDPKRLEDDHSRAH